MEDTIYIICIKRFKIADYCIIGCLNKSEINDIDILNTKKQDF